MISLCNDWEFTECWSDEFACGEGPATQVRLPHTCKELPLHYIASGDYQMVCGYRRMIDLPADAADKRVFLQFDGAAHIATVYVNGRELATHRSGYTAFRVEFTDVARFDAPNFVAVKLDTTENPEIPPFGFVIDYLTYGGLYREAWLDIRPQRHVEDIFVQTPDLTTADIQITVSGGCRDNGRLGVFLLDESGHTVWSAMHPLESTTITAQVPDALPWNLRRPNLYTCAAATIDASGNMIDWYDVQFGFRTAEFKADGFYLNGEKTFIRGLNRHQSYPYIGYAATRKLQKEDARILKEELGCNAVRTSHYPQSHHFIEACDCLGLLVFTEIPGWQHVGEGAWKDQAVENVREMVLQYRNHPSIILWGVRINESLDDDELYERTNAAAHELDPSRATSGVRYIEKSSLLEDVYAYNDFSHSGNNPGAKEKELVTPDMNKALLISECNGHMYPTKSYDGWGHRQEQALRHMRVMEAAYASGEHAGMFGWCMFDYPTHKDFGSGDRVCYHGVMDMFRNPKIAAAAYASQNDRRWMLQVGSSMDIGDYPAGVIGDVYVFTNAEEVELYKNGYFVTKLERSKLKALPHTPFVVNDTIGDLLETQEGYGKAKAAAFKECLLAAAKYTLAKLPPAYKLRFMFVMKRYNVTFNEAVGLFNKYVSDWGSEATQWRFDAKVNDEVVATHTCGHSTDLRLEVKCSHEAMKEGNTYDMAAVRVRILDGNGGIASYAQLPVSFAVTGDIELVGPALVTAEGGSCGTYVRTMGKSGEGSLTISTDQTEPVIVSFTVELGEES